MKRSLIIRFSTVINYNVEWLRSRMLSNHTTPVLQNNHVTVRVS